MNTIALSRLLARHLNVEDPANPPANAALDILNAINGGLAHFYRLAPTRLKIAPFSLTLRAPQNVTLEVAAKYSRNLTDVFFDYTQIGCTVTFPDLPFDNEVAQEGLLLDDHLSDTLATTVRVFGDAVPLNVPIERITSEVKLHGAIQGGDRRLVRDERLRDRRLYHQEGVPAFFRLESRGVTQSASPQFLFRVWPLPAADYLVRFEAECSALRMTFQHFVNQVEIPILDAYADDLLLPLCEAKLVSSPFWKDPNTKNRIEGRAQEVVERGIPMLTHDTGVPNNTVGTPEGF
jgi:hypothetical protein